MTQVGDVLADRYLIERPIARGGMADVFLARDQQLDRQVAVKVLFPEFARDPSFVERFRREAQNAAMLNHTNIVSVYDYGQQHGTYFIVMEYVEGQSLRDILRAQGRLPAMDAARIASEIAAALDFAHRHGVVHRDIKPGNVLLTPQGQVKVTDFGIAADPTDAGRRPHRDRCGHRHRHVLLARAGAGLPGRRAHRRVLARRRALRDAHRASAVHRGEPGRRRDEARARGADPAEPARRPTSRRISSGS